MANILSSIISNVAPGNKRISSTRPTVLIVLVDASPDADDGVDLPIGSIATWDNNGVGRIYFKTGGGVTDWTLWVTEPNPRRQHIHFIGSGAGASKTTTVLDGAVIAEEMRVGDELYGLWHFPNDLDISVPITIEVEWYLNATEVGKSISGIVAINFLDGMAGTVDDIVETLVMTDFPAPTPAFTSVSSSFPLDLSSYPEAVSGETMHMRFTRTASSAEPDNHPRLHHITVTYTPLYPSLA